MALHGAVRQAKESDMELLFIGIWVVCGLVAMGIYSNKGHSGSIGCLGGLLLGPVGVILALATPEKK
jgi:hypothetical protein